MGGSPSVAEQTYRGSGSSDRKFNDGTPEQWNCNDTINVARRRFLGKVPAADCGVVDGHRDRLLNQR